MTEDKPKKKPFPESQPFEETTFPESKPFKKTSFKKIDPFYVPVEQAPDEKAISAIFPDEAPQAETVPTPPPLDPADASADEEVYIIPEIVDETPSDNAEKAEKADAIIIDSRPPEERRAKTRKNRPPLRPPPRRR